MLKQGEPIPGSRYVRDFCLECGEPIRVPPDSVNKAERCHECHHKPPPPHANLTPRQKHGCKKTG